MSRNHGGFGSLPVAGFVRREGPSRQPSDFPRTFMAGLASPGSSRPANARPDAALVSPNRPQPRAFYLTPEEPHPRGERKSPPHWRDAWLDRIAAARAAPRGTR